MDQDRFVKFHYTCLCIVCDKLVEYPLCAQCTEEFDQLDKDELERECELKQKATPIKVNRKECLTYDRPLKPLK